MLRATTLKAISIASIIAVSTSFGATAFAHDVSHSKDQTSISKNTKIVSKKNARNLVKSLLKREYAGSGYEAKTTRKEGDKWIVSVKDRQRTVAKVAVDSKSGNIHVD